MKPCSTGEATECRQLTQLGQIRKSLHSCKNSLRITWKLNVRGHMLTAEPPYAHDLFYPVRSWLVEDIQSIPNLDFTQVRSVPLKFQLKFLFHMIYLPRCWFTNEPDSSWTFVSPFAKERRLYAGQMNAEDPVIPVLHGFREDRLRNAQRRLIALASSAMYG